MHTFVDPLDRAVQIAANQTAIVDEGRSFTFAELKNRCERLVGGLLALGLDQGDRVAILADNCHQYIETYVGVPAGGLVVVPLNTRHAEPELRYALEDSATKVLLTDRVSSSRRIPLFSVRPKRRPVPGIIGGHPAVARWE